MTAADVIVTANPGCMLQLQAGARLHGKGQRVAHVSKSWTRRIEISRSDDEARYRGGCFDVPGSGLRPAFRRPAGRGFRLVEVASVADAIEQLYGQRAHMSHEDAAAVHHQVRRSRRDRADEERRAQGGRAGVAGHAGCDRQRAGGSVYVMVLPDGGDFAGIGGLMATAMKVSRPGGRGDRRFHPGHTAKSSGSSFPSSAAALHLRRV